MFEEQNLPQQTKIIGKGIYRRVRFILDIDKIFSFLDFMSNFREMTPQRLRNGSRKKFKLLKYEHTRHHFKAHDLEIPLLCWALLLELLFRKTTGESQVSGANY